MRYIQAVLSATLLFSGVAGLPAQSVSAQPQTNLAPVLQSNLLAAENGNASAQVWVGNYYNTGLGGDKDYKQAFDWFSKAAPYSSEAQA